MFYVSAFLCLCWFRFWYVFSWSLFCCCVGLKVVVFYILYFALVTILLVLFASSLNNEVVLFNVCVVCFLFL